MHGDGTDMDSEVSGQSTTTKEGGSGERGAVVADERKEGDLWGRDPFSTAACRTGVPRSPRLDARFLFFSFVCLRRQSGFFLTAPSARFFVL